MKVTIITGPYGSIPPNTIGAVERLWYNIGKEMVRRGHIVRFISKRYGPSDRSGLNADGIYVDYIKGYPSQRHIILTVFLDFFYSVRALWRMEKSDVVVFNTFWTPVICPLWRGKFKSSVYNVERTPKGQMGFYKVDRLSCVSKATAQVVLVQSPSTAPKVKVINNPVDTHIFRPVGKTAQEDGVVRLAYSGRVHPEKGLDILVKAFAKLNSIYGNLRLTLIGAVDASKGGGGKEYADFLTSLAGDNPLVFEGPYYDPAGLRDAIARNDIFCYPSVAERGETFGVAPLEAMAIGIPTVVSALECFSDFVRDGENAIVFDHRTELPEDALADAMAALIEDKKLRENIGRQGAADAACFSVENIASQYIADFEGLLNVRNGKKADYGA